MVGNFHDLERVSPSVHEDLAGPVGLKLHKDAYPTEPVHFRKPDDVLPPNFIYFDHLLPPSYYVSPEDRANPITKDRNAIDTTTPEQLDPANPITKDRNAIDTTTPEKLDPANPIQRNRNAIDTTVPSSPVKPK